MKIKKINNVDLSVCSAEQKIAYNFALRHYQSTFNTKQIIDTFIKTNESIAKYNIEAITKAFKNGFENYKNLKYHILTNYYDIGKTFYL